MRKEAHPRAVAATGGCLCGGSMMLVFRVLLMAVLVNILAATVSAVASRSMALHRGSAVCIPV